MTDLYALLAEISSANDGVPPSVRDVVRAVVDAHAAFSRTTAAVKRVGAEASRAPGPDFEDALLAILEADDLFEQTVREFLITPSGALEEEIRTAAEACVRLRQPWC